MSSFSPPLAPLGEQAGSARARPYLAHSRLLAMLGLALYVVSFFLIAVGGGNFSDPLRGYNCALFAFFDPWQDSNFLRSSPFEYFSLLIGGWTNLLFLAATVFGFWKPGSRAARALAVAALVCIPFCWVVFACETAFPREGHFAWVVGMVLTLAATMSAEAVEHGKANVRDDRD